MLKYKVNTNKQNLLTEYSIPNKKSFKVAKKRFSFTNNNVKDLLGKPSQTKKPVYKKYSRN